MKGARARFNTKLLILVVVSEVAHDKATLLTYHWPSGDDGIILILESSRTSKHSCGKRGDRANDYGGKQHGREIVKCFGVDETAQKWSEGCIVWSVPRSRSADRFMSSTMVQLWGEWLLLFVLLNLPKDFNSFLDFGNVWFTVWKATRNWSHASKELEKATRGEPSSKASAER